MAKQSSIEATDQKLVDDLLDLGSESAFRELHRRHTPRMLQLVIRMLGRTDGDAEDLIQESWIRGVKNLTSFRGDSLFGTWIVGICIHVTQDYIRKKTHDPTILDELPEQFSREPPHVERMDVEEVIALLPTGYRTVLLLHDLEGFTHAEIAEMLGIAEGTSKSQLFAARKLAQSLFDGTKKPASPIGRGGGDERFSAARSRYME